MGARGATASSEAADVVLVVDELDRVSEALAISHRSRAIALQSVIAGMGMSFVAMLAGASGLLVPVAGAMVQELIDVIVFLNALRALRPARATMPLRGPGSDVAERFRAEHREFVPWVQRLRTVADRLDQMSAADAREQLAQLRWFLLERLVQHEEEEEAAVYPVVASVLGGVESMGTMERAHMEIEHLSRVFGHLLDDLPTEGPTREDLVDLRRVLYGLHAVLRLHFAQEDEAYAWLASESDAPVRVA